MQTPDAFHVAVQRALSALESEDLNDSAARREALEALNSRLRIKDDDCKAVNGDLTRREQQIHSMVVQGLSNPQIANTLFISVNTVRFHVSKILSKMGVANRAELIIAAMGRGAL